MAWIEVHQSLSTHWKTYVLAETLQIRRPEAVGAVVCIWLWALDACQDGDLSRVPDQVLKAISGLEHDGAEIRKALETARFINPDETIHDWDEYAGKLIQRRKEDRERKRAGRVSRGRPEDGVRTAYGRRTDGARTQQ